MESKYIKEILPQLRAVFVLCTPLVSERHAPCLGNTSLGEWRVIRALTETAIHHEDIFEEHRSHNNRLRRKS